LAFTINVFTLTILAISQGIPPKTNQTKYGKPKKLGANAAEKKNQSANCTPNFGQNVSGLLKSKQVAKIAQIQSPACNQMCKLWQVAGNLMTNEMDWPTILALMTHLLRVWSRHLPKETLPVVNVSPASLFLRWMDI